MRVAELTLHPDPASQRPDGAEGLPPSHALMIPWAWGRAGRGWTDVARRWGRELTAAPWGRSPLGAGSSLALFGLGAAAPVTG